MKLKHTALPGVLEILPVRHTDHRGYFSETYREDWFEQYVTPLKFPQENQSCSHRAGVVRGLHFQSSPAVQGKLVRCVAGAVFDVAVDIRQGSPHYGKWVGVTLSADKGNELWIPPGFLHGFCTLVPACIVAYKVTSYYDRACDMGVRWNDPDIGIDWPELADASLLSAKDTQQPLLRDLPTHFTFEKVH